MVLPVEKQHRGGETYTIPCVVCHSVVTPWSTIVLPHIVHRGLYKAKLLGICDEVGRGLYFLALKTWQTKSYLQSSNISPN